MGLFTIITGFPGAGKTRFTRSLNNIGVIDVDKNSECKVNGEIIQVKSIREAHLAALKLAKDKSLKTLVVDSFTALNSMVTMEYIVKHTNDKRAGIDYLFMTKGRSWYEIRLEIEAKIMIPLLNSGKNIFIVCHSRLVNIEKDGIVKSYYDLDTNNTLLQVLRVHTNQILFIDRITYSGGAKTKVSMYSSPTDEYKELKDCTGRLPRQFELDDNNLSANFIKYMKGAK